MFYFDVLKLKDIYLPAVLMQSAVSTTNDDVLQRGDVIYIFSTYAYWRNKFHDIA